MTGDSPLFHDPRPGTAEPPTLEIAGKAYVLVPRADYERLRLMAERPSAALAAYRSGVVGAEIRSRRIRAGLTVSELAERAGIRLETLSRIEHGRTHPSFATVQSIVRVLGESG